MKKKYFFIALFTAILITGCNSSDKDNESDIYDNTETSYENTTTEATTQTDSVTVEVIPGEFSEFSPTPLGFKLEGVDFSNLPDGTRELFEVAVNIWCLYYIDSMLCDESTAETITMPINDSSYVFYRTGISYDSFDLYLRSVFADDYLEGLKANVTFINNFNELLCLDVKGVVNSDFSSMTFEITEQTDERVTFTGTAKYVADDGYAYEKELTQQMVSIGGSWRLSSFNCWY